MENPTHTFRYMNLVLHTSYDNCDIEEKLDEVELKEKRCFFQKKKGCSFILSEGNLTIVFYLNV